MTPSIRLFPLVLLSALFCLATPSRVAAAEPDLVLADFEGADYGAWTVTGEAFGPGPAQGALPGQMSVSGYQGKGLVNSFFKGDDSIGTLTSPVFKIERRFLNFLLGGGQHPGQTCVNLLIDGKEVRTASGPNDQPGGSEHLDWHTWDVREFLGQTAVIEIVDQQKGGWGHINVDHIVQSETKRQSEPAHRELLITKRYLHLPVQTGGAKRRMKFSLGDHVVRDFEIELAEGQPDFLTFSDLSEFQGKNLRIDISALPADSKLLEILVQSDDLPDADQLYREPHRPQFHFTSRRGWHNDPNGLVYFQGEYHLFYQHNPYGWNWGNMHWGHAVSSDLVQWRELPEAIYPQKFGDWVFSGSAFIDWKNTGGWAKGGDPVMVAAYTSTGRGEVLAYSHDRGRTWTDYEGNPVVKHQGRDPKVIWHEPSQRWVMAVYDEFDGKQWIAFYTSPDLHHWDFQSHIEGFFECPDLFQLPVAGRFDLKKWVLYAADGKYILGEFDGREFRRDSGKHQVWWGDFYAAQTYSDTPDGRRVQIGWGRGVTFPGSSFNQQMTIACELTLRETAEGIRMFAEPVNEIAHLHQKRHGWKNLTLKPGDNPLSQLHQDLLDLRVEFTPDQTGSFGFNLRGTAVTYDAAQSRLRCLKQDIPLPPIQGKVRLQILLDRGSIEVFGNNGQVALSQGVLHPVDNHSVSVFTEGNPVSITQLDVYELRSIWK